MNSNTTTKPPLFVDLDGTLIKTDLLLESSLGLLKRNIFFIFLLPLWLFKGKAFLKSKIATYVDLPVSLLPYNRPFLDFLKAEHKAGRALILATAANEKYAHSIAEYLGIFTSVICSNSQINLSGKNKLNAIQKKNCNKFSYAGNAKVDLKIFKHAASAIIVEARASVEKEALRVTDVERVFKEKKGLVRELLKAIRIYQWVKNLLIFIPLLLAHLWYDEEAIINSILGFFAFCLAASSVYVLNDMLDLNSDRSHPSKQSRPFASGNISLSTGSYTLFILLFFSVFTAFQLPKQFLYILVCYLFVTFSYSAWFKRYALIDVVLIASLYTARVIAGAALIEVVPSFWLLAFSMFIFFSLALVKRCSELYTLESVGKNIAKGRGYKVTDVSILQSMGISSGYISILVIAFFINSNDVLMHYRYYQVLWLICPILFYWLSRVWMKTARGEMHDDPIIFSMMDKPSILVAFLIGTIIFVATF